MNPYLLIKQAEEQAGKRIKHDKLTGKITHDIVCMSPICGGRVIGHHYKEETRYPPIASTLFDEESGEPRSGILSQRKRLDDQWGFSCVCGYDTILAPEERGIITPEEPTEAQKNEIKEKIARREAPLLEDNFFLMREV